MYPAEKNRFSARKSPFVGLLFLTPLGACESATVEETVALPVTAESGCDERSALEAALHGGIETNIKWSGSDMICENMPRPNGAGIRLQFAGDVAAERLSFIIALPHLQAGQKGIESPANVTVTVEGSGRFFTTPGLESCWLDVHSQQAVSGSDERHELRGILSCIAPLGEVNGDSSVSISDLLFETIIEWRQP